MQPESEGLERREPLEAELRDLALRVARIERELGLVAQAAAVPAAAAKPVGAPPEPMALMPILGRALLGLAGAYLLRALTESSFFAAKAGVAVGLLYAIFWLLWAARTPAALGIEAALHSLTSVLVLAPLLWEAVLRFHAVSTWTAGATLLVFTLFGLAVSWRKDLLIVATIATLAGLGTAAALLVATHDVLPFTFVLLAIAAAVEASACLDHWLSERWLAATAANLAIVLATWLVTNERGLPASYAPVPKAWLLGAQMALLGIYLSSTIVRTLLRGFSFTGFERAQVALAFVISVTGGLRLANEDPRLGFAMGLLTLACAAACYWVSFSLSANGRNFYTYSTFGFLLAMVGTRILVHGLAVAAVWGALALGCGWAGARYGRMTLGVHGAIYLLAALVSSGALAHAAAFVLGNSGWAVEAGAVTVVGACAAGAFYVSGVLLAGYERGDWWIQVFRLVAAGALAWLAAGILAGLGTAAYHAVFGETASHAYCATLRTGLVAMAGLLLAWAGSRWDNLEISRLAYPAMVLAAYRLVADDLHQDQKAALFLSLLLYGTALMALPRLKRTAR